MSGTDEDGSTNLTDNINNERTTRQARGQITIGTTTKEEILESPVEVECVCGAENKVEADTCIKCGRSLE